MACQFIIYELNQTCSFRGSKSRNKVSVGEPAEGSLTLKLLNIYLYIFIKSNTLREPTLKDVETVNIYWNLFLVNLFILVEYLIIPSRLVYFSRVFTYS